MTQQPIKPKTYTVPALEKAIFILEHLSKSSSPLTLSQLCNELELPKTTVFSLLNTLELHSFVRRDPSGHYHLGLNLFSLGMASKAKLDTKSLFVPRMEQLRDATNFTVHLSAYDNGMVVCLEKIEGSGMIRFNSSIGRYKRMNTNAVGKATAAYLSKKELQVMFDKGFDDFTPNSITNESAFLDHLEKIREFGYAIDDEEGEMGVRCIGVPLFLADGLVFGAISLSTLKSILSMQKIPEYAALLMDAAKDISLQLGYRGPYPKKNA